MENETLGKIMRNYAANDSKKKNEIKKLKKDNACVKKMIEGMKAVHEKKNRIK